MQAQLQDLVRAGRHEEAATLAEAEGAWAEALGLYEKLWRFDKAWPLAEALGDLPRAVRLALEARAPEHARRLAARVAPEDTDALLKVAQAFAGRGQFEAAAAMAERAGDRLRAADLYRRAGLPIAAAGALVAAGRLRDAARLLETVIATADPAAGVTSASERAQAELAMGKLLARLGRAWDAARALQGAAQHPEVRQEARRHLCGVLLDLGLRHAADEVALRLHREDPQSPRAALDVAANLPTDAREVPERFAVDRLLGAGSIGRVYLAHDRLLDRPVALKALSVGATGAEEQALARFVREAEAAGRLRHPHIVALHDVDLSAGLLVFEYLNGGSLAQHLEQGDALPLAKVRRLGLELLDALTVAHEADIVHRDVKPANVFLDAAGSAKLGDFGAAHLLDFGQTQTGGLIGTLAYLSPEQVTGDRIGPQADLYGLAATLFEALTGRPPFLGPDFVSQHLAEPPPLPSALLPSLPADAAAAVDAVLIRALAKAPEERYASTRAMAAALASWPVESALETLVAATTVPLPALPAPEAVAHVQPEVLAVLGAAEDGHLRLELDPRTEREVVVWRPHEPLQGERLRLWQKLAACGGPRVQRVLGLADARGQVGAQVLFERLEGPEVPVVQLGAPEARALEDALSELASLLPHPPRVVSTLSGPVVLLQPPLRDREPQSD